MIVLVDTSVWSLALRRDRSHLNPSEEQVVDSLATLISEGLARMVGPVRQELLSGIRSEPQFELLRERLRDFPDEPLQTVDFERAAVMSNHLRGRGISGSPTDCLIAAVAEGRGWAVFTRDLDFKPFQQHLSVNIVGLS